MLCPYLRSSQIGNWKTCELQTLLTYVFGMESKAGAAASGGTCMHKMLELRALGSMAKKRGETEFQYDDDWGMVDAEWAMDFDKTIDEVYSRQQVIDSHVDWKKIPKYKVLAWAKKAINDFPQYDPANLNIVQVEQYFDIEIKENWAKYSKEAGGQTIEGYLRIKGTIDCILDLGNNIYECYDFKGLPIETPIPTPNGWSTMGDLKIGDIVYDQYGKKTKITGKSKQKIKNCYKITFDDTSTAVCDDEHYWTLYDGTVVQIKDLKLKNHINTACPIECEEKELPVDPYVLGIWLGDGRNRGGEVTSADSFVFEEIERRGYKLGKNQEKRKNNCSSRTIFGLTPNLRKLNVLHNKHIPEIYFRASYQQRLDLLRGLMDSDGTANNCRKHVVFMNCTEKLSDGVKELALTLGQRPLKSKTIQKGFGLTVTAYPVSFRPVNINPFLLPVKSNKVMGWGNGKSHIRTVTKIEKVEKCVTQCIEVDSPDRTYLCTKNMIPTHNSGKRACFSTGVEKDLSFLEKDHQLLFYLYALKKIYPDKDFVMTLNFVNDGGIYSVVGDQAMYDRAEKMVKRVFKEINGVKYPTLLDPNRRDFRCKYCCAYSKPAEFTNGKSVCEFIHGEIKEKGLQATVDKYADLNKMGNYSGGGKIVTK